MWASASLCRFLHLQVPVKAFTTVGPNLAQQLPAQLAQLAKAFQVPYYLDCVATSCCSP